MNPRELRPSTTISDPRDKLGAVGDRRVRVMADLSGGVVDPYVVDADVLVERGQGAMAGLVRGGSSGRSPQVSEGDEASSQVVCAVSTGDTCSAYSDLDNVVDARGRLGSTERIVVGDLSQQRPGLLANKGIRSELRIHLLNHRRDPGWDVWAK